jgi:hypothetical protein
MQILIFLMICDHYVEKISLKTLKQTANKFGGGGGGG